MPYVASIGTHLSCWRAPVAEVHDFFTGIELIGYEGLGFAGRFGGARIGLAHNIVGPAAASAVTILEGPADGAG